MSNYDFYLKKVQVFAPDYEYFYAVSSRTFATRSSVSQFLSNITNATIRILSITTKNTGQLEVMFSIRVSREIYETVDIELGYSEPSDPFIFQAMADSVLDEAIYFTNQNIKSESEILTALEDF